MLPTQFKLNVCRLRAERKSAVGQSNRACFFAIRAAFDAIAGRERYHGSKR
jgi:hypothetical protein